MKIASLIGQKDTSGSKAAALVGAGIGLFTFIFSNEILGALQPLQDFLANFNIDTQNLPINKATVGSTGWLGSWAILHHKWKKRKKRIRTLLMIGFCLLVLCLIGLLSRSGDFNFSIFHH